MRTKLREWNTLAAELRKEGGHGLMQLGNLHQHTAVF
jgi:hypothetical protein